MKKISTLSFVTLGVCALSLNVNAQLINESFEGAFPPAGWTLNNTDNLTTFAKSAPGKTGSMSAKYDNWNQTPAEQGQIDELITSAVNLSSVTNPALTFQRAYQMFSDPAVYTAMDALDVAISTDGGSTWTSLFNMVGSALVTATNPIDSVNAFSPSSSEWAMENISLSAYATATSAQFRFQFTNDWENNFYLDDIKVAGATGVNEIDMDSFVSVFPNPSNGNFNVAIAANGLGQADIIVYNMVGEQVDRVAYNVLSPKNVRFNLENQPNGVYFVKVVTASGSTTKKLVINN